MGVRLCGLVRCREVFVLEKNRNETNIFRRDHPPGAPTAGGGASSRGGGELFLAPTLRAGLFLKKNSKQFIFHPMVGKGCEFDGVFCGWEDMKDSWGWYLDGWEKRDRSNSMIELLFVLSRCQNMYLLVLIHVPF